MFLRRLGGAREKFTDDIVKSGVHIEVHAEETDDTVVFSTDSDGGGFQRFALFVDRIIRKIG